MLLGDELVESPFFCGGLDLGFEGALFVHFAFLFLLESPEVSLFLGEGSLDVLRDMLLFLFEVEDALLLPTLLLEH